MELLIAQTDYKGLCSPVHEIQESRPEKALFTAISLAELEMTPSADTHCGLEGHRAVSFTWTPSSLEDSAILWPGFRIYEIKNFYIISFF